MTHLDNYQSEQITSKLNFLLADVQIFYQNVRGYHWNIKGNRFFILHGKFEELYDSLNEMADEVAERILMLGQTPMHSYSDYISSASIKESKHKETTEETVKEVISGIEALLTKEREIIKLASEYDDEGTIDLMTGYISAQEKTLWMYKAFLG